MCSSSGGGGGGSRLQQQQQYPPFVFAPKTRKHSGLQTSARRRHLEFCWKSYFVTKLVLFKVSFVVLLIPLSTAALLGLRFEDLGAFWSYAERLSRDSNPGIPNPGIPAHFLIPNPGIGDALIPGFRDYENAKNARILQDICPKNTFSPNFWGNSRL